MKIQRAILSILPHSVLDILKRITNNKRLRNWEKQGKPVPPPHIVKQLVIKQYQQAGNYSVLVETGTYYGDMLYALRTQFTQLYSIELSDYFYKKAVKRFKKQPQIKIIYGDSGKILHSLVSEINTPAIFWLDGHYSGGETAKGEKDCPIYGELAAIFGTNFNHILLIDDARKFDGTNSYPTLKELSDYVLLHRPDSRITVKDDIIRIEI